MTRHQLELIEKYIEQKMTKAEMVEFENAMLHDPLLKNEFELQKDIIESIKSYRKAEIKSRLDKIQINPTPHYFNFLKIAASVTVTSFMVWGAYTYFNDTEEFIQKVEIPATAENLHDVFIPEMPTVKIEEPEETELQSQDQRPVFVSRKKSSRKDILVPQIKLPNVSVNFEDESPIISDEGLAKSNSNFPLPKDNTLAPEILVKELPGKKNQYFYQNYDGKLYLYGNFSASPYELIELNTETGRRLFLKYNSSYFNIKSEQKDIVPLELIQDTSLVQQLDILNKKN